MLQTEEMKPLEISIARRIFNLLPEITEYWNKAKLQHEMHRARAAANQCRRLALVMIVASVHKAITRVGFSINENNDEIAPVK